MTLISVDLITEGVEQTITCNTKRSLVYQQCSDKVFTRVSRAFHSCYVPSPSISVAFNPKEANMGNSSSGLVERVAEREDFPMIPFPSPSRSFTRSPFLLQTEHPGNKRFVETRERVTNKLHQDEREVEM